MNYRKTPLPKGFNTMKITPREENPNYHVVNPEGATMNSFVELIDARVWRDHFFNGYYSTCSIVRE